jgi:hypothetical protein
VTLEYRETFVESLPAAIKKLLEGSDLAAVFDRVVRKEIPSLRDAVQDLKGQGEHGELDVLVTAEELKSLRDNRLTELLLTLGMEDVRFGNRSDPGEPEE